MAERSNENRKDQIRVVDEVPTEVIRLDAEKEGSLKKKGGIPNAVLAPAEESTTQENSSEENSAKEKLFDPEREWLEFDRESDDDLVPMGWFVLLAVGLFGILGWVVFQTNMGDSESDLIDVKIANQLLGRDLDRPKGAEAEESEREAAEVHFNKMEKVMTEFLSAESLEEMIKWVRHPERVAPLMESYYARNPIEPLVFRATKKYHSISLENKPFIALEVRVEEKEKGIPILIEDRPDGMLVDWESFVCYLPMSPEDLAKSRPTELMGLRVYAQRDNFYTYEFSDESEFDCFRLNFRGSETTLYGFVKKGTTLEREFLKAFPLEGDESQKAAIIKARFLEESKATRSMLIEGLESTRWAFPHNPQEVSGNESDAVDAD
jgi:hypothetical protein